MTHQESAFFLEWSLHHINTHLMTVADNLHRHMSALYQSLGRSGTLTAAQLISNGKKNPVLLVDLHKPCIPIADDIHILCFDNSDPKVNGSVGLGWKNTLLEYWRDESSVTKSNILVAAIFPNHFGYRKTKLWTLLILLELLMVEPLQYTIPNRSFICNQGLEED
ncbi:hypothetical protein AAF712_014918 [Marasmius tenuissimus]|uniref:Uncharacterized protein n=1 Tax=Marasmius tenuissimus TaxID=585030 RepID=A0ABR2ZD62_9AGAR